MIKFGTGGWRAIIGEEFTKANIQKLSKGLALKMKDEDVGKKGIVLGYDRRFLSKESMRWAAEIFAQEGIKAYLINKSSPTPLIMFYIGKHKFHYGMMITASHNPAIYNGIKVFTYGGQDADEFQTKEIENYIKNISEEDVVAMNYDKALELGLIVEFNPLNEYIDNIISEIDVESIRNRGLRIALDPMYGVSETSLKTILLTARCDVETIHDRHDTLFGGKLPSPTAATLKSLQNYVIDHNMDIGIATDGDADRIGIIDDKGRFLHPNEILVILYYYLVKHKKWHGDAVRNVATTHMLDKVADDFGEKCHEVPVGFKHISAKMDEVNAIIGGESSGGLAVRGHIKGKDGIYAAILLVEMISVMDKKLSEITQLIREEYGCYQMEERDYKFSAQKKEEIQHTIFIDKLIPDFPVKVKKISYLDGCKIYFENGGWIIIRFSGTEPLLRIYCEMLDEESAKTICNIYEEFLELGKNN